MYKIDDLKVGNLLVFDVVGNEQYKDYVFDLILEVDKKSGKIKYLTINKSFVNIGKFSFPQLQRIMDRYLLKIFKNT